MEELFVIKIGGNVIDDPVELEIFLHDLSVIGKKIILVHGGGKIASKIGEQLGIIPLYNNGRRITDERTLELVTMVYGGLVNKNIVAKLQAKDCNCIGLTGADANILTAAKRPVTDIDYGFAGDIDHAAIGTANLQMFLDNGLLPVIAPLTHDGKGQILNTNADTIASSIARALSVNYKVRLVYCFEKKGILSDMPDENSVIPNLNKSLYKQLLQDNKLFEGIIPKIDNAFDAIDNGVKEVIIGHANNITSNCSGEVKGTLIT